MCFVQVQPDVVVTPLAGQDPLLPWAMPTIHIVATTIVARQVRGLHISKVMDLKGYIMTQWLSSSFITVQLMVDGAYRLVDGMPPC